MSPEPPSEEQISRLLGHFEAFGISLGRLAMPDLLKLDLTMPQMKVLFVLWHRGPSTVGTLATAIGVSLPTMTGILDRLVEHGLAQRFESPEDRRLVMNRLTEAGSATVSSMRQAREELMASILRRLSADDLEVLARVMEKLRLAAEEERRD